FPPADTRPRYRRPFSREAADDPSRSKDLLSYGASTPGGGVSPTAARDRLGVGVFDRQPDGIAASPRDPGTLSGGDRRRTFLRLAGVGGAASPQSGFPIRSVVEPGHARVRARGRGRRGRWPYFHEAPARRRVA